MQDDQIDKSQHLPEREPILTKARSRRKDVIVEEGERGGVQLRSIESPLDYYFFKRQITGKQRRAGMKLRFLWLSCCGSGYRQMQYRESDGGSQTMEFVPPGFGGIEYRAALDAISGNQRKHMTFYVCCEGLMASKAIPFPSKRTAERKSMMLLREALDQLIDHFEY